MRESLSGKRATRHGATAAPSMPVAAAVLALLLPCRGAVSSSHPDPPGLAAVDCVAASLGVKMAARNFPNDPASAAAFTRRALHADKCGTTAADAAAATLAAFDSGGREYARARPAHIAAESSGSTSRANVRDEVEIVVATTGSDATGDGTVARPFATLARAQAEIRRRWTAVASRPAVAVRMRAGTYYQSETLTFGPSDSGASPASPVVYEPYGNESVTMSGGARIDGLRWQRLNRPGLVGVAYSAALPPGAPRDFTTLFVDGERAVRARFPNGNPKDNSNLCFSAVQDPATEFPHAGHVLSGASTGTVTFPPAVSFKVSSGVKRYGNYPDFDGMVAGFATQFDGPGGMCTWPNISSTDCSPTRACTAPCGTPGTVPWFAHYDRLQGTSTGFAYDPATWTPRAWKRPQEGVVRAISPIGWGSATFPIKNVDTASHTVSLGAGGWQIADSSPFKGTPFYVEGIAEELDAPWEWYLDSVEGVLYFFPNQTMPTPPPTPPPPGPAPPGPIPPGRVVIASASNAATQCSLAGQRQGCCVDLQFYNPAPGSSFSADNCHPTTKGANQIFSHDNTTGLLKVELNGLCLSGSDASVTAEPCDASSAEQRWAAGGGLLENGVGCLAGAAQGVLRDGTKLVVAPCKAGAPEQQWSLSSCPTPSCLPPGSRAPTGAAAQSSASYDDHGHGSADVPPPNLTEAVLLDTIVRFQGTPTSFVCNVVFRGVRFAHAATTQLRRYEVPSGGDWSIFRGGAVVVENAENVQVADSFFDSVGGNGLLLSRHAQNCSVRGNRFSFPGDSAVVALGVSNMADGTAQTYPTQNTVEENFIHDIGSFGKEVSCYFQAVAGNNTVRNNICLNGPRAGLNLNDGFLGANVVEGNLIANQVRESHDHGPLNSWDRIPYATRRPDGSVGYTPEWNQVRRNLIINGYQGVWALDHDDGSSYYNDTSNVLFYGGCKNFRGDHKLCGPDNLIVYPGIASRSAGGRACQTNDNAGYSFNSYVGNKCITQDGEPYTFNGGSLSPLMVPFTANNTFYSPNATFDYNGHSLAELQAHGLDVGSVARPLPSLAEVAALAEAMLGLQM